MRPQPDVGCRQIQIRPSFICTLQRKPKVIYVMLVMDNLKWPSDVGYRQAQMGPLTLCALE